MDGFVQEKPNIDEYFLIRRISRGEKWHEVWIFVEGSRSRKLDFPNICNLSPSIFQLYITIIWTIWYAMLLIHFSCYLLTKAISPVLRLWVSHLFFSCSIGHFRVPKTLTFKMRLGAQSFYKNEFYLHENEERFPYQMLSTYPRFETEARGNSEMAYWILFFDQIW